MGMIIFCITAVVPSSVFADVIKTAVFHDDTTITLNGTVYDARIVTIEGESYVPIHILGFVVNAITDWDETNRIVNVTKQKDPVTIKQISQSLDGKFTNKVAYFSDKIKLVVDGKELKNQVIIVEGRSYLPLKAIAENMGIRVISDEANKTIKVTNPAITIVDPAFKDYYVRELPPIEKEEDYLIGNWAGTLKGSHNSYLKAFISKNPNGTYKVVFDWTDIFENATKALANTYTRGIDKSKFNFVFNAQTKIFEMNHYGVVEYIATYNAETNVLECVPSKLIKSYKKNDSIKGKASFRFILENEILHFTSSNGKQIITGGQLERF